MVELIIIKDKKTVRESILLAFFGLSLISFLQLIYKKVCLRNSYAGSSFWGSFFMLEAIVLAIVAAAVAGFGLGYWALFIMFMLPLFMTGCGLIGGKCSQDEYLKDIDKLLNYLIKGNVFSLAELEKCVPKSSYVCNINENQIIYMMKDLADCGVLSYQVVNNIISVNFLLPAFKALQPEHSLTCPNCGAEASGNVNAKGVCICEYCGTILKE